MRITACPHPSYFVIDGRIIHESSLAALSTRGILENPEDVEKFRGEFLREQAYSLEGAKAVAALTENAFYRIDSEAGIYAGKEFQYADFEIPEGVKIIRKSSFRGLTCLTSVTFSDSVEVVEEDAFNGCVNLREVTFNYGLKTIQHRAFIGTALSEPLYLPASVASISPRNVFPSTPRYVIVDRSISGECMAALRRCGLCVRYKKG